MILKDFAPPASLSEFVQCYRIVHFHFAEAAEPVFKAYGPRPEVCLHFFLRERELVQMGNGLKKDCRYQVALVGQQTAVINRYLVGKDFMTFNIVFQPTAFYRLTGISSFEITDKYLDAALIFRGNILLVLEQLQAAAEYNEMIAIANRFIHSLVSRLREDAHQLDTISRWMINYNRTISLDWLAKESYLSTKQFTRKFYERTGVTPKTYLKIARFTRAVHMKNAYPHMDWLRIAVECDYFDYQHLVKDYKGFTKHTPNGFHLLETNSPEQKLGLTAEVYKNRAPAAFVTS